MVDRFYQKAADYLREAQTPERIPGRDHLLETLGVAIELGPAGVARCVAEAGMGFCLAPRYHAAIRHAGPPRRELGIPTANLAIAPQDAPEFGIYVVTAFLAGRAIAGIASWGTRPHFDDGAPLLEVHLFDFAQSIYGAMLSVRFDAFLRPEARFADIEEFMAQIQRDIAAARSFHQL